MLPFTCIHYFLCTPRTAKLIIQFSLFLTNKINYPFVQPFIAKFVILCFIKFSVKIWFPFIFTRGLIESSVGIIRSINSLTQKALFRFAPLSKSLQSLANQPLWQTLPGELFPAYAFSCSLEILLILLITSSPFGITSDSQYKINWITY